MFRLFFIKQPSGYSKKDVNHHRTGFRSVDYDVLKKPIRVAAFIKQAGCVIST